MPPTPPPPPRAVAAVLLFARDPAALAAFYRDQLGVPLRPYRVAGLAPHFACDIGHVYVSIWPHEGPPPPPDADDAPLRPGLALYVPGVTAAYERLVAAGVRTVFPPRATPLGVIARLRDPEGHALELYEPLPKPPATA